MCCMEMWCNGEEGRLENQEVSAGTLHSSDAPVWIEFTQATLFSSVNKGFSERPLFPHSLRVRNGSARLRPPFRREPTLGGV